MTYKEFISKLPKSGWYLKESEAIRRRSKRFRYQCPITAAAKVDGTYIAWGESVLGLTEDQCCAIAEAADNDSLHLRGSRVSLRKQILRHIGLKEE